MNADLFPLLLGANKYRLVDWELPRILPDSLDWPSGPVIFFALVALSIAFGYFFASATRLRDYGWKIALITGTVLVSLFVVLFGEFKLGVDLKGGVILVYEINKKETEDLNRRSQGWTMGQLTTVISERLNPTGLNEIVVRPFGPTQVEIVVPEVDPQEVDRIQELIETGGVLQFMIVASQERNAELFEIASQKAELEDGEKRLERHVVNADGVQVGFWAKFGREKGDPESAPFRATDLLQNGFFRDARTGEILELTQAQRQNPVAFEQYLKQRGTRDVDVLMAYDEEVPILGKDLAAAYGGVDEAFRPAIHFTMSSFGAPKMGFVTQENIGRKLAIIFDNTLLSAPVIQSKIDSNGQITGNFSQEEVDFIVGILKSGSMPVVMQKQPTSKNQIGSILGRDTIIKGSYSVVISLGLILVFLVLYYRFAGLVASFALTLNLLLTVAIMVLLKAPFTLPGLAGLVLTVAMSVDANVLISERMREELERGATLRMAIRNGFDKALSAIIDGNLTTFLTALVLYFIGTDQVKGFGMTLMLGNITSMFTAIFCARTIFDVAERTRFVKTLSMGRFLATPNVDWTRFFMPATIGSLVLILVGLGVTIARGKGLFDIDLAGGTSVTFILKKPMGEEEVRARLEKTFEDATDPETNTAIDHNVYGMQVETEEPNTVYKVDSSLQDVELLKQKVREGLREGNQEGLKTFTLEIGDLTESEVKPPAPPSIGAPGGIGKGSMFVPASPPGAAKTPAKTDGPKLSDPIAPQGKPGDKAGAPQDKSEKGEASPPTKAEAKAAEPEVKPAEKADEKASDAEPKSEKAADASEKETPENSGSCGEELAAEEQEQPEAKAEKAAEPDAKSERSVEPEGKTEKAAESAEQKSKSEAEGAQAEPAAPSPALPADSTATSPAADSATPAPPTPEVRTTGTIKLPGSPISAAALRQRLSASSVAVLSRDVPIRLENPNWDNLDNSAFEEWTVTLPIPKEQAEKLLQHAKSKLENEVVWQTSSKIGGQVSEDTRFRAIGALAVSMLGIVAYVWFRFQKVAWGLAAVAAIAHDALVMLTGIAASYWLVPYLGFAGVEEFKISLPVVAAFLTILGYSVNDTIVIFDRLREIRGKSPDITRGMLNAAVNQTLGRTIILAGITLAVVVILYAFGGPGIHAFAFALVIGVISGCYSTLSIAAPMLLWLLSKKPDGAATRTEKPVTTKSVA